MHYTRIIIILILFILCYYIFFCGCNKISLPTIEPVIEQTKTYIDDLKQHNDLVLNQLNTYIEKQKIPNYIEESIPNGSLKFHDIHDTY